MSRAARSRLATLLGVAAGLVAALAVAPLLDGGPRATGPPPGRVLTDCEGALEELVLHWVPAGAATVETAYRDFLHALPASVRVHVVCRDEGELAALVSLVGEPACALVPVYVDHPITGWARDRWLALDAAGGDVDTVLVSPRAEAGGGIWPARRGDERVGDDLAAVPRLSTVSVRSDLFFDGGDFVVDDETAFVTPAVRERNLQRTVHDEDELRGRLERLLDRRVVLLDVAPEHHAGMFLMPVGNRTVLVGDPGAARELWPDISIPLPGGADFTPATQACFDAVAARCEREGYRVVRMPVVPAPDGRTYLTPLNAILDARDGERTVYMPVYAGAAPLNRAAGEVWASLGYRVQPVDCTTAFTQFGSLRCLVNVLRRAGE